MYNTESVMPFFNFVQCTPQCHTLCLCIRVSYYLFFIRNKTKKKLNTLFIFYNHRIKQMYTICYVASCYKQYHMVRNIFHTVSSLLKCQGVVNSILDNIKHLIEYPRVLLFQNLHLFSFLVFPSFGKKNPFPIFSHFPPISHFCSVYLLFFFVLSFSFSFHNFHFCCDAIFYALKRKT